MVRVTGMLGDTLVAGKMAEQRLEKEIYVIGFSFPVVPKGKARVRTQISAAHSSEDLQSASEAFRIAYERLTKGE